MQLFFQEVIDMASQVVSPAEIEKFRVEKIAEREFLDRLSSLVTELKAKVSDKNSVLRSMQRFLKANI